MAKDEDLNDKIIKLGKEHYKKEREDVEEVDAVEAMFSAASMSNNVQYIDRNAEIMSELNSKHIFINTIGGISYVTYSIYNEVTEREELEFMKLETFKNIYSNRPIEDDDKRVISAGQYWIQRPERRTVDSVIFDPSEHKRIVERGGRKYLNMWEGFSTEPIYKKSGWKNTQRHIFKVLCNSNPIHYKYVMKWLAWSVQNPDKQAEVALVFKGEKGAGKSFLFMQLKKIFGRHGMVISDPNRLVGQHTGHLADLSFLFCDEVYYPGNKEIEGRIKAIITQEYLDVRKLFRESMTIKNRLHLVMCTNNEWVIPASSDERRYFVENINNMYAKGKASQTLRKIYFDKLWGEMEDGGREAMLYDLMKYKLKGWHPRDDVPDTDELNIQKELSLNPLLSAIKQMINDGVFPGEYKNMEYMITTDVLSSYLIKLEPKSAHFTAVRRANAIKELGAKKSRVGGDGRVKWAFPPLHEMRRKWNSTHGIVAWEPCDNWIVVKTEF